MKNKTHSHDEQIAYDRELVQKIQQGDQRAFAELYDTYSSSLFSRIFRMIGGNMERTEDLLQQVFLKVLQSLSNYKGDNVLHAWLNRITTFVVIDEFRAYRSKQGFLAQWRNTLDFQNHPPLPEYAFYREEMRQLVNQALEQLDEKKRIAVVLCDVEGYTLEEASKELGVPQGTLASRVRYGRKELFNWLANACKAEGLTVEEWLHV